MNTVRDVFDENGEDRFTTNAANLRAITMSQLMTEFEKYGDKFDTNDQALLKQLTSTETLFCEFCNRPISSSRQHLNKELTTPYAALLDCISALLFVLLPIAWIPLLMVLSILAIIDAIKFCFDDQHQNKRYKPKDFDREYFPNQFRIE